MNRSDRDWSRFYGNQDAWINDLHPQDREEHPTVSTVVHCHHDSKTEVPPTDFYHCFVVHVRGFHGKGFMPAIRGNYSSGSIANGDVFYGTTEDRRLLALVSAKEIMRRMQAELNERMEANRVACLEHEEESNLPVVSATPFHEGQIHHPTDEPEHEEDRTKLDL